MLLSLTSGGTSSRMIGGVVLLILTGACSSAPGPATTMSAPPVVATGGNRGVGLEVNVRNEGQQVTFAAEPDAVFTALEATFASLEIPLSRRQPEVRTLGNDGLKMRRKFGKLELRRVFDCGGTAGMPNSETYNLTAGIVSSVAADSRSGSVVTTVVDASAENPSYPGSVVRCSSNGVLEDAITNDLRARLNQRP
jgi:hypothetical protein